MTPQEIVNRILDFGLDEVDADNALEARVLGDVNQAYVRVLRAMSDRDITRNSVSTSVVVSSGSVTIPEHMRIFSVQDTTNNRTLEVIDVAELESITTNADLTATGAPTYAYVEGGTTLKVFQVEDVNLTIRYYPVPNVLTLASLEADIRIPSFFHEVLVFLGIYYTGLREQGFHDQLDRRERLALFDLTQNQLLAYLTNLDTRPKRVKYNDG